MLVLTLSLTEHTSINVKTFSPWKNRMCVIGARVGFTDLNAMGCWNNGILECWA